jgi:AraC family transcriptional regulator
VEHRIEKLTEKKLIGKRLKMSFADNKTGELWRGFMPRLKEIQNKIGSELYSMQIYNHSFFENFNPNAEFEKWATVEVKDFDTVPEEMECFVLKSGLYAVFLFRGTVNAAAEAFRYIFETWLPNSEYVLDDRPHFELLGEKYKNGDPNSEEEIWIPIKPKKL